MPEWSPDESASPEGEQSIARVMTLSPIKLRLVATPHPRQPEGHTVFRAVGALHGELTDESPVLAQGSLPSATFDAVQRTGLFDTAVPLMLTAQEDEGGIRGTLAAIVSAQAVERAERAGRAEAEPWLASVNDAPDVPDFSGVDDAGEARLTPFLLGVILRFPEDRKYPDSLNDEAIDLLATLLSGEAMDADRKRVENLLKSL